MYILSSLVLRDYGAINTSSILILKKQGGMVGIFNSIKTNSIINVIIIQNQGEIRIQRVRYALAVSQFARIIISGPVPLFFLFFYISKKG